MLLFSAFAYSQGRKITGTVKDDKGQAVSFATITETNTTNAAVAQETRYRMRRNRSMEMRFQITGETIVFPIYPGKDK